MRELGSRLAECEVQLKETQGEREVLAYTLKQERSRREEENQEHKHQLQRQSQENSLLKVTYWLSFCFLDRHTQIKTNRCPHTEIYPLCSLLSVCRLDWRPFKRKWWHGSDSAKIWRNVTGKAEDTTTPEATATYRHSYLRLSNR